MGTIPRITESIKDKVALVPMHNCCNFAYLILKEGRSFIKQKAEKMKECDSKVWSEEFQKCAFSHLSTFKDICDYSPEDVDFCYAPKIEGGDNYNEYLKTIIHGKPIGSDTFKRSVGVKIKNYYCYFVRTTILHGTRQMRKNHAFMRLIYKGLLRILKDGVKLRKVYHAVLSFAHEKDEYLAKHLEKELGFELCSNFKNESVVISPDSNAIAKRGMILAINVNLIGLYEGGARYNLYYSDTVIVRKNETPMTFMDY